MSRLYCLVKKTENHRNRADEESILDPMRKSFQDHIATQGQSYESIFIRVHIFQGRILEADFIIFFISVQGKEAIRKVKDSATTDPKSYVDTILDIHRKYHALVTQAFDNDSGFATSLDRAASNFVNS